MEGKKVKLVFTERVYKKHAWTIPIVFQDGKWWTGQDLSYEKMTGKALLTKEEEEKYPYVINPEKSYKVQNNRVFDFSNPADNALYELCLISEKIAKTKSEHVSAKHLGYFEDKALEASQKVVAMNKKFEAMKELSSISDERLNEIVLMLNYMAKKEEFNINIKYANLDEKKIAVYEMIEKNPSLVLSCFPKYNPLIEEDLFIFKLIHNRLIIRHGLDYYESVAGTKGTYLGGSIDKVKEYVLRDKSANYLKEKFEKLLNQIEKGLTITIPYDVAENITTKKGTIDVLKAKIKANLFDKDYEVAKQNLAKLAEITSFADENYKEMLYIYNDATGNDKKRNAGSKKEEEYKVMETFSYEELIKLLKKPGHLKHSNPEVFTTKEEILEFIKSKTFA